MNNRTKIPNHYTQIGVNLINCFEKYFTAYIFETANNALIQ